MTALFDPHTKARRLDPETSHQAARMADGVAEAHKRSIMDFLEGVSPMAASHEDIARATGIEKHAVARRLPELVREGRAVVAGRTLLESGRSGQTWRAK